MGTGEWIGLSAVLVPSIGALIADRLWISGRISRLESRTEAIRELNAVVEALRATVDALGQAVAMLKTEAQNAKEMRDDWREFILRLKDVG